MKMKSGWYKYGQQTSLTRTMHRLNPRLASHLVIYGLLVIHTQDSYLFAIRRAGSFMTPFIKGRVEILRTLKRRQTRDILEKASGIITGLSPMLLFSVN